MNSFDEKIIPGTIDAHQHLWQFDPVRDAWITEDMKAIQRDFLANDLLEVLTESGVEGSIAVQADTSENETAFLVEQAERNDFIKGVVGWVDLCSPAVADRLAFYREGSRKIKGFRHIVQAEPDDNYLLREDFCRGIAALGSLGFTYDILIYPKQLPAAIRFVEKFPDQRFVVDHLAKPLIREKRISPWAEQMNILSGHPNVFCKVSGMVTEADWQRWNADALRPYLDVVFETFGPERLMFGSDWPVCLVAASYREVIKVVRDYTGQLDPAASAAVMGGNARHFYQLEA
ncbi:amidohydrolase family protein [Compostibacter hankyongensis]|uniref:Amidohydrolase family protein n=1 Tax=Compostibacter hankyongensis TaxID=1007089 RepID=A0ABP8G3P4_9BACT